MKTRNWFLPAIALVLQCVSHAAAQQPSVRSGPVARSGGPVRPAAHGAPPAFLVSILKTEDTRRCDDTLLALLRNRDPRVRERAALAAGRIGDARAVAPLVTLLESDADDAVRAMAAFALGEIEAPSGAAPLLKASVAASGGIAPGMRAGQQGAARGAEAVRARALEALGKIAAALPRDQQHVAAELSSAAVKALAAEAARGEQQNRQVLLLAITAVLRARPAGAVQVLAPLFANRDARVRAGAANAFARLRLKGAEDKLRELLNDADPVVRANAARALADDRASGEALWHRATGDADSRVRISAIRSIGALRHEGGAQPLFQRMRLLLDGYYASKKKGTTHPAEAMEVLEIVSALGRIYENTANARALQTLGEFRDAQGIGDPEVEMALARIGPAIYVRDSPAHPGLRPGPAGRDRAGMARGAADWLDDSATRQKLFADWRVVSAIAQGLAVSAPARGAAPVATGEGATAAGKVAEQTLHSLLADGRLPAIAASGVLRAYAAFRPAGAAGTFEHYLGSRDVIVRATAAELLGELPPSERNAHVLAAALQATRNDMENDATLAALDALARQKSAESNTAIASVLAWPDHLVRRRAVALLKANGAGDFSARVGAVATRNTDADYRRALSRRNGTVRARVATDKGTFVIELLPEDAPLTVDNFVRLARHGFFNGIAFHRVVPNFVIQGGDPRGDGNGGPGWQIRCEVNTVPYERGAVGMALSGKDTGGSQWFVTHAPQPHLDGGYTVFGRVVAGMNVVDSITRWDRITRVTVVQ